MKYLTIIFYGIDIEEFSKISLYIFFGIAFLVMSIASKNITWNNKRISSVNVGVYMFFDSTVELISIFICGVGFLILFIGSFTKNKILMLGFFTMMLSVFIFVTFFEFNIIFEINTIEKILLKTIGSLGTLFISLTLFRYYKTWEYI